MENFAVILLIAGILVGAGTSLVAPDVMCCARAAAAGSDDPRCPPTAPEPLGPFYKANAPVRTSVGQGYLLRGTVRSAADCRPIAGAQIEFWLAGPNGQYDDDHRATVFSDNSGSYQFESNFPPKYSFRPPHIHLRVSAAGFQTLVTQHYPVKGHTQGNFDLVLVPVGEGRDVK